MAGKNELRVDNKNELMYIVSPDGGVAHYGGYRHDFISQALSLMESQLIVCKRCAGIMRDACSVRGGMAMVCATCIGDDVAQPVGAVREMVAQLKCKCPLSQRGCEWEGTVANVSQHLDQCAHLIVPCPYLKYGCEVVMKRLDNAQHREVSKEWHTELMSLFLAGRVEQQAEMIEQLQLEVHTMRQEMKYLKLNGIVWKLEKDMIEKKIQEPKGQPQPQYDEYGSTELFDDEDNYEGLRYHIADLPGYVNFLVGSQFFIDSFGIAYPQLSFESDDTISLYVTNNASVNFNLVLQQQQSQPPPQSQLPRGYDYGDPFNTQTQPQQVAQEPALPGTWEVVIVNNEDTEVLWKVEVGKVTVTSGQGFKLANIPAGILLDKKYYRHRTMDIQIRCKSD